MNETREFDAFVARHEPRLRRALVAAFGPDHGPDASASALAWAWENWERMRDMDNAVGYLYRVGQSSQRAKRLPVVFPEPPSEAPRVEPGLLPSLAGLTHHQRVAVVLVYAYGYQLAEAAEVLEVLEVSVSTLRNHLQRGLKQLRQDLGVTRDA